MLPIDERLLTARKAAGLTQRQAGQELGFSRQSIGLWENRQAKPHPLHERLLDLACDEWLRRGARLERD